jgi:hypothetical protein
MEPGITVHLDEVGMLAAELARLGAELDDEALICRSVGARLREALGGDVGWRAGAVAGAWEGLARVVAARAEAVAATLTSATVAYRDRDAALAAGMGIPSPRPPA